MKAFFQSVIRSILPTAGAIAMRVLDSLAQNLWDSLWDLLLLSIGDAERKFRDGKYAEVKKQYVIDEAIKFITKYRKLSKIQLWALKTFIGKIVDRIIKDLNENNGKTWVAVVTDLKAYWAGRIPLID